MNEVAGNRTLGLARVPGMSGGAANASRCSQTADAPARKRPKAANAAIESLL